MADEHKETGERIRHHVRTVLGRLSAFAEQQRSGERPGVAESVGTTVEVEREDDEALGIGHVKSPT
jgi:hypothetical protein